MRPFIGVTCSADDDGGPIARAPYMRAVHEAGGMPVALPFVSSRREAEEVLEGLTGVVLTGSEDLDASLWGEETHPACTVMHPARQATEMHLCSLILERELPVLGICGGMQNLAVAAGGSVEQHLPDRETDVLDHAVGFEGPLHDLACLPGSRLAEWLGTHARVNTAHHQAVGRLGAGMQAVAHAPDGVLEAYEMPGRAYALGVQWHPERLPEDARQQRLFRELVAAAAAR